MNMSSNVSEINLSQVVDNIFDTRRISRKDQRMLMSLLLSASLGEEEEKLVTRIYESLHKGLIRVID